jgi:HAD superfamily hydrolase (TIGR01490 family)
MAPARPRLALFDLDHTLLCGDSDVLWCDFLMAEGLLPRDEFAARNADMEARYKAGTVGTKEFAEFYVSTLAGRSRAQWEPLRRRFLREQVVPRIAPGAPALVREHLEAGDTVVITTATNRFITELTARHFGVEHLIATEAQVDGDTFTGRTEGTLNMRDGKVTRLHGWLGQRGKRLADFHSTAYSDSVNDLPLLGAVDTAVVVDGDARLLAHAAERGWKVMSLR